MDRKCFFAVVTGFLTLVFKISFTNASCYFSQQFQGEYVMQNSATPNVGGGIVYSALTISPNAISIWGNCHKRIGNNVILMFNYTDTSCYTCLHLKLRSQNVLQVFASSKEIISKCFTNEASADANCPSPESLEVRGETEEILLFKVKDDQGAFTQKQYCPIDGKYYTNYKGSKSMRPHECSGFSSTVDSCPSGSTLNFRLRNCTFDSYDLRFECLGHWKGPKDETFLVFTDSRHLEGQKSKYRCALYKQDATGKIEMAVSRDSTCTSELYNSTSGFETFVLAPKTENPWPPEVSFGICSFPKWMFGSWEYVRVEGDTMVYKDHTSFKTYTIKCAGMQESGEKYLVFSRTQCDEESFNCLKIASRSKNILEFQLGMNSSVNQDPYTLCAEENFDENSWVTQGRLSNMVPQQNGLCPITGEYAGRIPDAPDLCAKLWSDCRAPDLMYYQVSDCSSGEIYEEREYQCLGHWSESSLLYTFTERRDVADGTYECFVGSIINDKEFSIKEAGEHCQRNIDPVKYGMKLTKTQSTYSCKDKSTTRRPHLPSIPNRFSTANPRRTTVKMIESNAIPDLPRKSSGSNQILSSFLIFVTLVMLFLE
ncbi:uncharacterized protein LOC126748367 [Anthonomus grandis grandis]|uniref:uncharacterized protein LOC126748367 n=1 Tax=Anthonomus grandis grandis TaxID=2921223 RepID=UPI0021663952|nr:uncharacterized protein LOC126748367 [Anthonomus grandis grandis]